MTTTMDQPVRRTHRGHPKQFPHSTPDTVVWYVGETAGTDEVHVTSREMLDRLLTERLVWARARVAQLQAQGGNTQFAVTALRGNERGEDDRTTAVILWVSNAMRHLRDKRTRDMLLAAMASTRTSGVYVALELSRLADRNELMGCGWGNELMERLRRDQGGTTVIYGNW